MSRRARKPNAELTSEHLKRAAYHLDNEGFRQKVGNKLLADKMWRLCDAVRALARQLEELTRDNQELR